MSKNAEIWNGQSGLTHYSLHYIGNDLWLLERHYGGRLAARKIDNTPAENKRVAVLMLRAGATPDTIAAVLCWYGGPNAVVWEGVCDANEPTRWRVISVAGRLFKMRLGEDVSVWSAEYDDAVELLLRAGLTAEEIAKTVPTPLPSPELIHPRDVAKERLKEFGEHLVNDSLSGVLELLLRSVSSSAAVLAPPLLKHLGVTVPEESPTKKAADEWATVADSFDSGRLAGQIDSCQMLAEQFGWEIPFDILVTMQTGRLLPVRALQILGDRIAGFPMDKKDVEEMFEAMRKVADRPSKG